MDLWSATPSLIKCSKAKINSNKIPQMLWTMMVTPLEHSARYSDRPNNIQTIKFHPKLMRHLSGYLISHSNQFRPSIRQTTFKEWIQGNQIRVQILFHTWQSIKTINKFPNFSHTTQLEQNHKLVQHPIELRPNLWTRLLKQPSNLVLKTITVSWPAQR